jgi:hypothetical protein
MKKFLHVVRVSYGNSSDCSKTDTLLRQQDAEMLSNFSWNCLHFSEFLKKKNCLLENRNTYGDDFQLNQQPRSIRSGRAGLQFRVVLASSDSPKDQIV